MITQEEREYLIESMSGLLAEYDYKYTTDALNKIIDEWSEKKKTLIEAFKKHPKYVDGKFMIAFTSDYERVLNEKGAREFSLWLANNALRRTDITPKNILDRRGECAYLPADLWNFLAYLQYYVERCISEKTAEVIKNAIPEVKVRAGEKTSRAVNRILTYLGYDKIDGYQKAFAKYADSLSPMSIKRYTVLSVNPLDYLTMSFGNSWSSCHTIDTKNKRNMENGYHGMYSSGTMSYMLDAPSMVLYTVDSSYNGTEYWSQPKINRQMFHYAEDKLVQSRLYPQDNDRYDNQYEIYRKIVQGIMAKIFGFPNLWTLKIGASEAGRYIWSSGTHYRDYNNFNNCSLSIRQFSKNTEIMEVGADPICVRCGKRHQDRERIDHCVVTRCADCGCAILEEGAIVVDGKMYCRGCVHWCDVCQKYHRGSNTRIRSESISVCDACRNEHFAKCEECGEWECKEKLCEYDGRKICRRCKRRHDEPVYTYNLKDIDLNWFNNEIDRIYIRYNDDGSYRRWYITQD